MAHLTTHFLKIQKKLISMVLVALVGVATLVILSRGAAVRINCQNGSGCREMSSRGAVIFSFSQPVDAEKVSRLWQTDPSVEGYWNWLDEKTARWSPKKPLPAGSQITLIFNPGEAGQRGENVGKQYIWEVVIRPAHIMALGRTDSGTELFIINPNENGEPVAITQTDGRVADYSPSPDGEQITFSVENDFGGLDLWIADRTGKEAYQLLDCQQERCGGATWSPNANRIAYTREHAGNSDTSQHSSIQVEVLDLVSGAPVPLPVSIEIAGSDAKWSPDEQWMSYWNIRDARIELIHLDLEKIIPLETTNGNSGCWSSDGQTYYYSKLMGGEGEFQNVIMQADAVSGEISKVLGEEHDHEHTHGGANGPDYDHLSVDNPACSPADGWLAARIQPNVNIPGYELIAYNPESDEEVTIMQDFSRIISAYSWSPDGQRVVLQTFPLGGGVEDILIWVWERPSGEIRAVSSGLRIPKWLP